MERISETIDQVPSLTAKELNLSQQNFESSFANTANLVPELSLNAEASLEAGIEIIDTFGIKSELFDDPGRAMVFSFIADRSAKIAKLEPEHQERESFFIADAIALLAHEHSPMLKEAHAKIEGENAFDEATIERGYDKFTDKQLSAEVQKQIDNGLLAQVKEKLQITAENEDPYEVRVLAINGHGQMQMGLEAPKVDWDNLPTDYRESQKLIDEATDLNDQVKAHWDELDARTKDFAASIGKEEVFAPAWVTTLNGKRLLCLSQPLAEKIAEQSLTENSSWYGEDEWKRDFAILEHEYTHTQGGVNLDKGLQYGINLEELRAEAFSGDKQGYDDVKGLFGAISIVTGEYIRDPFEGRVKGGTTEEIYAKVAQTVGVDITLDVLLAAPMNYLTEQTNPYIQETFAHTGGYDGIVSRLIDREISEGRGAALEARIDKRFADIMRICKDDPTFVLNYQKHFGLNVMSDILLDKYDRWLAERPAEIK